MLQRSMSNPIIHAVGLCSTEAVKTADCMAPIKFIHVVSESCAGYRLSVIACNANEGLGWPVILKFLSENIGER